MGRMLLGRVHKVCLACRPTALYDQEQISKLCVFSCYSIVIFYFFFKYLIYLLQKKCSEVGKSLSCPCIRAAHPTAMVNRKADGVFWLWVFQVHWEW